MFHLHRRTMFGWHCAVNEECRRVSSLVRELQVHA